MRRHAGLGREKVRAGIPSHLAVGEGERERERERESMSLKETGEGGLSSGVFLKNGCFNTQNNVPMLNGAAPELS